MSCCQLLLSLVDILYYVSFFLVVLLLLGHPLDNRLVIQLVVVEIISNRQENVEYLTVTFTR
jgi:hypothetical protein